MYLLFMYESERAEGGRNDFVKTSDSLKECIEFFKNTKDEDYTDKDEADIYDTELNRWYTFTKENKVTTVVTKEIKFIPDMSTSEESLQKEKELYEQLNKLVPMSSIGYHLQTK